MRIGGGELRHDIVKAPAFVGKGMQFDRVVIGLMDPAHGPWVHKSWYWRSEKSIHEKAKAFGPVPYGFQMRWHKPSKNGRAYKLGRVCKLGLG